MRKVVVALAALIALAPVAGRSAQARVLIAVDKSTQRMTVSVNGVPNYAWNVSTGRANFGTPSGTFAPQRLARTWFSSKYYNSPMPYSIFFHKGYAIHGSNEISKLGGPASHGCIRLHPQNAATLFSLVSAAGPGNTTIVVSGESSGPFVRRNRAPDRVFTQMPPREAYPDDDRDIPTAGIRVYRQGRPAYVERDGWADWGSRRSRYWR